MPQRLDVSFPSGNARCAAWLYLPNAVAVPPVIVMAHGLGGVREMRASARHRAQSRNETPERLLIQADCRTCANPWLI